MSGIIVIIVGKKFGEAILRGKKILDIDIKSIFSSTAVRIKNVILVQTTQFYFKGNIENSL